MLNFNSIGKYHIVVIVLISVGLILYVNNYISGEFKGGKRQTEIKSVQSKCSLWTHKNCQGDVPEKLCNTYKKLNPESDINCLQSNKKSNRILLKECECSCLRNFSTKLPVWPINEGINWKKGKVKNIEIDEGGNYIKLAKTANSGKWISPVRDWFQTVKYAYVDIDSEVTKGEIKVKIQVSDDNLKNVKDSTTKTLYGGMESFGLCNLSSSRYLKITADLKSEHRDKELTTLHSIWLYINRTKSIDEEKIRKKYPKRGG